MKLEIDNSFLRDVKKLPESVREELAEIYSVIQDATSLENLPSIKKMVGQRKRKTFRIKLEKNSDYRIGLYLEGDTVILSRILNRKDIYKKFPPK